MWIVNFQATTYPFPLETPAGFDPSRYRTEYALEFIDAQTGEFVWSTAAADPR
jgi:hypothetical protein